MNCPDAPSVGKSLLFICVCISFLFLFFAAYQRGIKELKNVVKTRSVDAPKDSITVSLWTPGPSKANDEEFLGYCGVLLARARVSTFMGELLYRRCALSKRTGKMEGILLSSTICKET